jgi:hypothetical protein
MPKKIDRKIVISRIKDTAEIILQRTESSEVSLPALAAYLTIASKLAEDGDVDAFEFSMLKAFEAEIAEKESRAPAN